MRKQTQTVRRSLAVAVVAILASLAAVAALPAQAATNCSASSSWGSNRADLAAQVVNLINQYRAGKGLSQLAVSAPLTAASEWKSLHMAGYGYFAHDDPAPPVSRSAYQRARDCGYGGSCGVRTSPGGIPRAVRRQRLARLCRPQGEHREPWLQLHRRRRGSRRQRPALLDTELRQRCLGRPTRSTARPAPPASAPPAATPPAATPAASVVTPPALDSIAPRPASFGREARKTSPDRTASGEIGAKPAYVTTLRRRSRIAACCPLRPEDDRPPLTAGSVRCRAEVERQAAARRRERVQDRAGPMRMESPWLGPGASG